MLITIWGRDGSGKSTLADYLGACLARKDLALVIDTDLSQPTLPIRLRGIRLTKEQSLGRAIAGTGTTEIRPYLHQHPRKEGLFFSGLVHDDDYLAYELGLDTESVADLFVRNCQEKVDHVLLDCSGQRTDPFIPVGLKVSDLILVVLTPDLQGICWWQAVRPLLEQMNRLDKVQLVLSMVQKHHQPSWFSEGIADVIQVELPFAAELNLLRSSGKTVDDLVTRAGRQWHKGMLQLANGLLFRRGDVGE